MISPDRRAVPAHKVGEPLHAHDETKEDSGLQLRRLEVFSLSNCEAASDCKPRNPNGTAVNDLRHNKIGGAAKPFADRGRSIADDAESHRAAG